MSIYGNPVTLGPRWITAKKVSILPFQNLHGYDHPWSAGEGKNLADPDKIYLMSIGSGHQGWIYVDSPGGVYRTLKVDQLRAGTYTISTTLNNAYFIRYRYTVSGSVVGVNIQSRANEYTFTLTDDVTDFGIAFRNTSSTEITESFVVQIELGYTATSYAPYSNVCPISGWEDCRVWVSPTPDPADGTTYQVIFGNPPRTVYGGELDLTTGVLTAAWEYIASYAGETLPGRWISDRDTYAPNTSPTTGAEVCYELATPVTYQLTPQQISFFSNQYFGANCGPVLVKIGKQ